MQFIIETDHGDILIDPQRCPELRRVLAELFGNLHQAMEGDGQPSGKRRGRPPKPQSVIPEATVTPPENNAQHIQ
jgi:hypothetical protein